METVGTRNKTLQIVAGVVLAMIGVFLYAGGGGILVPTVVISIGVILALLGVSRR